MMCGILISSPSQAKLIQFALGKQAEEQREKEPLARNLAAFSYYFIFFSCFFRDFKDKRSRLVLRLVETT